MMSDFLAMAAGCFLGSIIGQFLWAKWSNRGGVIGGRRDGWACNWLENQQGSVFVNSPQAVNKLSKKAGQDQGGTV